MEKEQLLNWNNKIHQFKISKNPYNIQILKI